MKELADDGDWAIRIPTTVVVELEVKIYDHDDDDDNNNGSILTTMINENLSIIIFYGLNIWLLMNFHIIDQISSSRVLPRVVPASSGQKTPLQSTLRRFNI